MRKIVLFSFPVLMLVFTFQACQQTTQQTTFETQWLGETREEILDNIEEQFQGFSRTMMETAYRYHELYWAGMDQNWEYAEYQREHIEEAMDQGFIRRPERKQSAQQFMQQALPQMEKAIEEANPEVFMAAFTNLTASCNTCHAMGGVSFMTIKIPPKRNTVVYF